MTGAQCTAMRNFAPFILSIYPAPGPASISDGTKQAEKCRKSGRVVRINTNLFQWQGMARIRIKANAFQSQGMAHHVAHQPGTVMAARRSTGPQKCRTGKGFETLRGKNAG